jgi:hypothetical protein
MLLRKIDKIEIKKIQSKLSSQGFIKVENLIKPKITKKILDLIKKIYTKAGKSTKNYKGLPERDSKDLRIYNLPKRDKIFCDLISDIQLEKILKPNLNDKYYQWLPQKLPNYILGGFNGRSSGYKLDLHIDSIIPFKGYHPSSYVVLFVLEKMNKNNGATILVPKSHLSGKYTDRSTKSIKVIDAVPGDVLILDSRTWHGTTENSTNKSRWLINAVFTGWWIKQQINFTESMPKKILKKLSNKQKQLLGFCSIPPTHETDRINTKCGYEVLKKLY